MKGEASTNNIIILNDSCNQDCLFCICDKGKGYNPGIGALKANIKAASSHHDAVHLSGGEPTMRKDLFEIISFSREQGIKEIVLQTNGVLLENEGLVHRLSDSGITCALVSMHSHNEEVYDKVTGTVGDFNRAISGIKNLLENGIDVKISMVINSLNCMGMRDSIRFFADRFKISRFDIGFVLPKGDALKNEWIVPRISDIEQHLHDTMEYCRRERIGFIIADCGLPLCYLRGFEEYSAEARRMLEFLRSPEEGKHFRFREMRKSDDCARCGFGSLCRGVSRGYADLHGTEELYPVFEGAEDVTHRIDQITGKMI